MEDQFDKFLQVINALNKHNVEYEIVEYGGIEAKIATPETLFRLKKDTMRDKDKMDLFF